MWRKPRSAYFQVVNQGTPVTTSAVDSPPAGGPTWTRAWPRWVVPVHPVSKAFHPAGRHVELHREAPAGRPGGAEQPAAGGRCRLAHAHDTGGEMQQPGQTRKVDPGGWGGVPAGQHRRRGGIDPRPLPRQLCHRESGRIVLARRRQLVEVVRDEVLHHQRVVDRPWEGVHRPLVIRHERVRAETVVEPGRVSISHRGGVSHPGDGARWGRVTHDLAGEHGSIPRSVAPRRDRRW